MPAIRVEAASAVPWADVEHALTGGGDGASCWCQWFTIPRREFTALPKNELRDRLRHEVETLPLSPGLVAYIDDEAAGWVRISPRVGQPTLLRTRVVRAGGAGPLNDPDVWAITCFVVRKEFRGLGVAKRLTKEAVEYAASHGARSIEAYPYDTAQQSIPVNELYVGTVSLFTAQGFVETARPTTARVVMTRTV
jgi:ribosomal protein S18 acetylase RimI-like enzyme